MALKDKVDAVEAKLGAGVGKLLSGEPADLEALNTGLLQVGVSVFGKSGKKKRLQRSYVYRQQEARSVWEKKLNQARKRKREHDVEVAKAKLKEADKKWVASRRAAQREQRVDFIGKVTSGKFSDFYSVFQRVRTSKPPRTPTTHLDPEKIVQFFTSLYANPVSAATTAESVPLYVRAEEEKEGKDSGSAKKEGRDEEGDGVSAPTLSEQSVEPKGGDATLVSTPEVVKAFKQMKASCSGKDGVPPDLLIHLSEDVAPVLASLFT